MQPLFHPGDTKIFTRTVREQDLASFDSGNVHPVYSSFALVRDAEWTCRQFVLEMKEKDEEGIGASISLDHLSPALYGTEVEFKATLKSIQGHEITCEFTARVGERMIARGIQVQKILNKEKLENLFKILAS